MTEQAESHEALVLENFRRMYSDCETFQDAVGADDAEEALESIHGIYALEETDADETDPDPTNRCVLMLGDGDAASLHGTTVWNEQESLTFLLELTPPAEITDKWEQQIWFLNRMGKIRRELMELAENAGEGPYLAIKQINRLSFGLQDPRKNRGRNVWFGEYRVEWKTD